jgi:hypothetical protein
MQQPPPRRNCLLVGVGCCYSNLIRRSSARAWDNWPFVWRLASDGLQKQTERCECLLTDCVVCVAYNHVEKTVSGRDGIDFLRVDRKSCTRCLNAGINGISPWIFIHVGAYVLLFHLIPEWEAHPGIIRRIERRTIPNVWEAASPGLSSWFFSDIIKKERNSDRESSLRVSVHREASGDYPCPTVIFHFSQLSLNCFQLDRANTKVPMPATPNCARMLKGPSDSGVNMPALARPGAM